MAERQKGLAWRIVGQADPGLRRALPLPRPRQPGIGRSQVPPAGYSLEDMATDTLQVMDALGLEAAHVSGFSMGGSIALAMALRAPARVLTLSLHSTSTRSSSTAIGFSSR